MRVYNFHPGNTPDTRLWCSLISSAYVVIYVHQWERGFPESILDFIADLTPEHTIWIDGIEYARKYEIQ
jgi:hypothetical protein